MRVKLAKNLQFGHRVLKAGRTITVTTDRYNELLLQGYFDEKIIKPEPYKKKEEAPKDEEE